MADQLDAATPSQRQCRSVTCCGRVYPGSLQKSVCLTSIANHTRTHLCWRVSVCLILFSVLLHRTITIGVYSMPIYLYIIFFTLCIVSLMALHSVCCIN